MWIGSKVDSILYHHGISWNPSNRHRFLDDPEEVGNLFFVQRGTVAGQIIARGRFVNELGAGKLTYIENGQFVLVLPNKNVGSFP